MLGLIVAASGTACGSDDSPAPSPVAVLDQQNVLNGQLVGQLLSQPAQSFTVGLTGQLSEIRLPIRKSGNPTGFVILEVRRLVGGMPDTDDAAVLASASVGAASIPILALGDAYPPEQWPIFDLRSANLRVASGDLLSFSVRGLSSGFQYDLELTLNYGSGLAFHRDPAGNTTWTPFMSGDYGFQTFVAR